MVSASSRTGWLVGVAAAVVSVGVVVSNGTFDSGVRQSVNPIDLLASLATTSPFVFGALVVAGVGFVVAGVGFVVAARPGGES